jgi:dimeric dUTPase (all-alpha-NTP-PPase superfamily)
LGYGLGFNIDEIKTAYFKKNKINHQRQENNY